jgi:hypothetical protein
MMSKDDIGSVVMAFVGVMGGTWVFYGCHSSTTGGEGQSMGDLTVPGAAIQDLGVDQVSPLEAYRESPSAVLVSAGCWPSQVILGCTTSPVPS